MGYCQAVTRDRVPGALFVISYSLVLTACIPNQPAIRTVNPEAESPRPGARATNGPIVDVQRSQPTPTPIVTISEIDGMELVYVHAGSFIMGNMKIAHEVYLDAYWIDKTEVTNLMYSRCASAGGCRPRFEEEHRFIVIDSRIVPYYGVSTYYEYPVVKVSWDEAKDYCEWAGRRLPTEAEWERAARGTDRRRYPWGNEHPGGDRMNFCDRNCGDEFDWQDDSIDDGNGIMAPVSSYPLGAAQSGALSLAGNVSEWVADWYDQDYPQPPYNNNQGPDSGTLRVHRGGSFLLPVEGGQVTYRVGKLPSEREYVLGFRCAMSAEP